MKNGSCSPTLACKATQQPTSGRNTRPQPRLSWLNAFCPSRSLFFLSCTATYTHTYTVCTYISFTLYRPDSWTPIKSFIHHKRHLFSNSGIIIKLWLPRPPLSKVAMSHFQLFLPPQPINGRQRWWKMKVCCAYRVLSSSFPTLQHILPVHIECLQAL